MLQKIFKTCGIVLWVFVLFFVCLVRWYAGYQRYISLSDSSLQKKRSWVHDRVVSDTIDLGKRSLHYVDVWETEKPVMILIHGAPWSMLDRSRVMSDTRIYDIYRLIVVDRLWYGRSGMGYPVTSIQDQSDSIFALIDALGLEQVTVAGHSYGGPIVADILMRWWEEISWWLIFAGAVDPEYEKIFGISQYVDFLPMKFLMWPMLRSANREKLTHVDELTLLTARDTIQKPMRVVHGTADSLVPHENLSYMQERVGHQYISVRSLEWVDHPMQFNQPTIIVDELLAF